MRLSGVVALALSLLAASAHAGAEAASPQALRAAKQHFTDGKKFQDVGQYDNAIVEYEAAYKLAPKPQILFNIAQCQRLKGDKDKAIASYEAFLKAAPDDPAAEDAREFVSTLKLRVEVERAEAASKRAMEEAEAARKQAAEVEAARKRAEAEIEEKRRRLVEEQERQRQSAAAEARADRERQQAEARERERKLGEARNVGHPLRLAGVLGVVGGVALFGLSFLAVVDGQNQANAVSNPPNNMWTAAADRAVQQGKTDTQVMIALWGVSAALVVVGSGVAIAGAVQRKRAVESVTQARLMPIVTPAGGALVAAGRF